VRYFVRHFWTTCITSEGFLSFICLPKYNTTITSRSAYPRTAIYQRIDPVGNASMISRSFSNTATRAVAARGCSRAVVTPQVYVLEEYIE
jgi:hypothetical protein